MKTPFSEKLKRLDFLAPEVGLNYRRAGGVQTLFGVLLAFMASSVFLAGAVYIGLRFLDSTQANVLQEISSSLVYPEMNLVTGKRFSTFMVFEGGRVPVASNKVDRLITAQSVLRRQKVSAGSKNRFKFDIETKRKPLIPCNQLPAELQKLIIPTEETAKMYILSFGLCPQYSEEDFILSGKRSDDVFREIDIDIMPCSLVPATRCADSSYLSKLTIVHAHVEPVYNMSNFHNPVDHVWNPDDLYFFNLGMRQLIKTQLKTDQIWNDAGLLSRETLASTDISVDSTQLMTMTRNTSNTTCTPEQVAADDCTFYMRFQTISGGKVQKFIRSYKGAVETLGEIGGIRDIVFTAALTIYWIFHSSLTKKFVVDTIYGIKKHGYFTAQITTKDGNSSSGDKVSSGSPQENESSAINKNGKADQGTAQPQASANSGSLKESKLKDVHLKVDYDKAIEIIEDTLDVVNLLRRIQFLELFVEFMMSKSKKFDPSSLNASQVDQDSMFMASYVLALGRNLADQDQPAAGPILPIRSRPILASLAPSQHSVNSPTTSACTRASESPAGDSSPKSPASNWELSAQNVTSAPLSQVPSSRLLELPPVPLFPANQNQTGGFEILGDVKAMLGADFRAFVDNIIVANAPKKTDKVLLHLDPINLGKEKIRAPLSTVLRGEPVSVSAPKPTSHPQAFRRAPLLSPAHRRPASPVPAVIPANSHRSNVQKHDPV